MNRAQLKNNILNISNQLIQEKGFICSIDILCELDYLNEAQIKDWRFGKIQYLEKVCGKNLGTLSFINKTIKNKQVSKPQDGKKIYCSNCGYELEKNMRICSQCGSKIKDRY